ncbi:hypothetical protein ACO0RG_000033 [Hanseniaspora osmophila]
MAPPKQKGVKMDLSAFLNDESLGGSAWTDQEVDLNKIKVDLNKPSTEAASSPSSAQRGGPSLESFLHGRGSSLDPAMAGNGAPQRERERIVYEVPDYPPFKAKFVNFPLDVTENGIKQWFEDGLEKQGAVSEVYIPKNMDGTPKKYAFVTLTERQYLVESLTFNGNKLNSRTVYVDVAPPMRNREMNDRPQVNWGSARGANFGSIPEREFEHREPREQAQVNWGSARGANFGSIPERQQREFREPREPREQPQVNWGAAKGANVGSIPERPQREFREPREPREQPQVNWGAAKGANVGSIPERPQREFREPREPREPREQPQVNWGAARGANFGSIPERPQREQRSPREPREPKEQPQVNWGAARGANFGSIPERPQREQRSPREKTEAPKFNWGAARGAKLGEVKKQPSESSEEASADGKVSSMKSSFAVLTVEDDDEDEQKNKPQPQETETKAQEETPVSSEAKAPVQADEDGWETTK